MKADHRRLASAISAVIWAGVLLYFCVSGRINAYLVPGFRTYAIIGALGLAVIGLFVLLTHRHATGCGHHHDHDGGCEHDHDELPAPAILGCMIVPLLAATFLTQDSFSLRALTHKGAFDEAPKITAPLAAGVPSRETLERDRPRNERGDIVFDLLEIHFSSMDADYARNMEGLRVSVQGRVLSKAPGGANDTGIIYRLLLTCCAADGRPLSVKTRLAPGITALPENSWGEMEGTLTYQKGETGKLSPVLMVDRVSEQPAPAEEYLLRY